MTRISPEMDRVADGREHRESGNRFGKRGPLHGRDGALADAHERDALDLGQRCQELQLGERSH